MMSRFTYSNDELDINKVLKMNQDRSKELLHDSEMAKSRQAADANIEASMALLRSLGKGKEIEAMAKEISEKSADRILEHRPVLESWEEIVQQAERYEPRTVTLEDIMTEQEIRRSFAELGEINQQFARRTSIINKTDLAFLTIAIALQVTKSLIFPQIAAKFHYGESFDPAQRKAHNDKSIEKAHREANDQFRDKHLTNHGVGHWINILYQTVPYDITRNAQNAGISMGGRYHRMYTLGHDPILGWVFGTANILTDCITFNSFQTNRISRVNPLTGKKEMRITAEKVPVGTMFNESCEDIRADYLNLPAALFAQAQHLKSDEYTKVGLPVPILSTIDQSFSSKLYTEHYDALCFARDTKIVGASFVVSKLFDMIISLTHGLFRKPDENKDLYEVRTRKILLLSNSIASTSSIISMAITKNPKNLDIGSLLNTVIHLFSDLRFIAKIKQEFIENEISSRMSNEIAEIDRIYQSI